MMKELERQFGLTHLWITHACRRPRLHRPARDDVPRPDGGDRHARRRRGPRRTRARGPDQAVCEPMSGQGDVIKELLMKARDSLRADTAAGSPAPPPLHLATNGAAARARRAVVTRRAKATEAACRGGKERSTSPASAVLRGRPIDVPVHGRPSAPWPWTRTSPPVSTRPAPRQPHGGVDVPRRARPEHVHYGRRRTRRNAWPQGSRPVSCFATAFTTLDRNRRTGRYVGDRRGIPLHNPVGSPGASIHACTFATMNLEHQASLLRDGAEGDPSACTRATPGRARAARRRAKPLGRGAYRERSGWRHARKARLYTDITRPRTASGT